MLLSADVGTRWSCSVEREQAQGPFSSLGHLPSPFLNSQSSGFPSAGGRVLPSEGTSGSC